MASVDLSSLVPPDARWVKLAYALSPKTPGSRLIARVWTDDLGDAQVIEGEAGSVVLPLSETRKISYQNPVNVELRLKLIAYRREESPSSGEKEEQHDSQSH